MAGNNQYMSPKETSQPQQNDGQIVYYSSRLGDSKPQTIQPSAAQDQGGKDNSPEVTDNVRIDADMPKSPVTPKITNDDELHDYLVAYIKEHTPESKADREKRERREKIEGIISSSADAARAIANMIAVHNYAPNMYDNDKSMSTKMRERLAKEKAERQAADDRWFQYAMTLRKMDNEDAAVKYQHGRDAIQDQIKQNQDLRAELRLVMEKDKSDAYIKLQNARAAGVDAKTAMDQYNAEIKRIDMEYRERLNQSQINKNNRVGTEKQGSGVEGQHTVKRWDSQKNEWEYKTGFKTKDAAKNYAATYSEDGWEYAINPTITTTTTTKNMLGGEETQTSTRDESTPKRKIGW